MTRRCDPSLNAHGIGAGQGTEIGHKGLLQPLCALVARNRQGRDGQGRQDKAQVCRVDPAPLRPEAGHAKI